jgi:hypoxanthine phosphoribosyltransferase
MHEDVAKILLHTATILARLDEIAHEIRTDYAGKDLTVVMVLNGALMLCADLLRRIPLPLKLDCLRVSSYHGGTETTGEVIFDQIALPDINDRHVLIVDDILDSGLTLAAIVQKLRTECRPLSVKSCVLLRKKKERLAAIDADYVGFDIADEFVVGYGLDYDERYRNLPYIGVLRPEVYGA